LIPQLSIEDHYLLTKKVLASNAKNSQAIIKLFNESMLQGFTDKDLERAIIGCNYELALEFLDRQDPPASYLEKNLIQWAEQVVRKDLSFYRFIVKAHRAISSSFEGALIESFRSRAIAWIEKDLDLQKTLEGLDCPFDLAFDMVHFTTLLAPCLKKIVDDDTDIFWIKLLEKEPAVFEFTLEDLKKIQTSTTLKNLFFVDRGVQLFKLINRYAVHFEEIYKNISISLLGYFVVEAALKKSIRSRGRGATN
jgi:hypothetical protein